MVGAQPEPAEGENTSLWVGHLPDEMLASGIDKTESELRRLFSELVAMEQLLLARALPGTHEGMEWGLRALGTAMPRRCASSRAGAAGRPVARSAAAIVRASTTYHHFW